MGIHFGEVMNPREKFFLPAGRFRLKHSLLLHIALVGAFLQAARPAKADTIRDLIIIVQDSTDSIGVRVIGVSDQRVTSEILPSLPEVINVTVGAPLMGAVPQSFNSPFGRRPGVASFLIGEGDGTTSDSLLIPNFIPPGIGPLPEYEVIFRSDPGVGLGGTLGCCDLTEDGTVQTIGTVTWTDGTVDTIRFQSDSEVPEPSTILLMLAGFAGLGTLRLAIRSQRGERSVRGRGTVAQAQS